MSTSDRKRVVLDQQLDLVSAILTVIIAGATAFAGINVMSSISDSMSLASGDAFYQPMQDLQDGVGTFFQQLPTVFIVLALVLIIGYLTILRR